MGEVYNRLLLLQKRHDSVLKILHKNSLDKERLFAYECPIIKSVSLIRIILLFKNNYYKVIKVLISLIMISKFKMCLKTVATRS